MKTYNYKQEFVVFVPFNEVKEELRQLIKTELHSLNKEKSTPKTESKFMTLPEVCQTLQVSRSTLYNWREAGILVPKKIGKTLRYLNSEVEAILQGIKSIEK